MKFSKHVDVVLKRMCRVVGADFNTIDFKKEQWFYDHEWTQRQEDAFKKWLTAYLGKSAEARREFGCIWKSKTLTERCVNMFVMNYGWKNRVETKDVDISTL